MKRRREDDFLEQSCRSSLSIAGSCSGQTLTWPRANQFAELWWILKNFTTCTWKISLCFFSWSHQQTQWNQGLTTWDLYPTDPLSCVLTTQAEKDLTAGLAKMAAPPKLQSCKGSLVAFRYQRLNSQSAVVKASSVHDFGTLHVRPSGKLPQSQEIAAPTCWASAVRSATQAASELKLVQEGRWAMAVTRSAQVFPSRYCAAKDRSPFRSTTWAPRCSTTRWMKTAKRRVPWEAMAPKPSGERGTTCGLGWQRYSYSKPGPPKASVRTRGKVVFGVEWLTWGSKHQTLKVSP